MQVVKLAVLAGKQPVQVRLKNLPNLLPNPMPELFLKVKMLTSRGVYYNVSTVGKIGG